MVRQNINAPFRCIAASTGLDLAHYVPVTEKNERFQLIAMLQLMRLKTVSRY